MMNDSQNADEGSDCSRFFFWIMAVFNPESMNVVPKLENTTITAMVPKSLGARIRAKTICTTRETT